MQIELQEILDFLHHYEPFARLTEEQLTPLVSKLQIQYFRRGEEILSPHQTNSFLYMIRQGAVETKGPDDGLLNRLAEGHVFGYSSATTGQEVQRKLIAIEDSLCYLMPIKAIQQLEEQEPYLQRFFGELYRERLRHILSEWSHGPDEMSLLNTEVRDLVKREPVTSNVNCSIREAATIMSDQRVSSLLLMEQDKLVGIVTDRDLRSRVLAAGVSPDAPIAEVMTASPKTIPVQSNMFEALMLMVNHNIHHLPVEEHGNVVGLVTTTNLMRRQSASPVYLVGDIRKQESIEGLKKLSERIPSVLTRFVEANTKARRIGRIISTITDALTHRLLALAEETLGPPPMPYAWLVLGSQARQEQSSYSDQDNALLLAETPTPEQDQYFVKLTKFVSDGLNTCGFVYCPGDVMASNPTWRLSLSVWKDTFLKWMATPEPMALMHTSIFFDMRTVHDPSELYPQLRQTVLEQAPKHEIFLAHMARNALSFRPPLGFFRQFVVDRSGENINTFDLKHRGLIPIVDLARVHSLAQGLEAVNTSDRLEMALHKGVLHEDDAHNLMEAYEFLALLRLRHHVHQMQQGIAPNNQIAPKSLSPFERHHLRDAFQLVQTSQSALEMRYQVNRLG